MKLVVLFFVICGSNFDIFGGVFNLPWSDLLYLRGNRTWEWVGSKVTNVSCEEPSQKDSEYLRVIFSKSDCVCAVTFPFHIACRLEEIGMGTYDVFSNVEFLKVFSDKHFQRCGKRFTFDPSAIEPGYKISVSREDK